MSYFARIDKISNIVLQVHGLQTDNSPTEEDSINLLNSIHKDQPWINDIYFVQTSYNSNFRKKYAGIGDLYNSQLDAFISPKQFNSWIFNETTCKYEAPIPYPNDNKIYSWNEETLEWQIYNL